MGEKTIFEKLIFFKLIVFKKLFLKIIFTSMMRGQIDVHLQQFFFIFL